MFSSILDVALGLLVLYTVLSIATSAISELINGFSQQRAKNLEGFLDAVLHDTNLNAQHFFSETLISPQTAQTAGTGEKEKTGEEAKKQTPAYLKAADFSVAVLDLLSRYDKTKGELSAQSATEGQKITHDHWKELAQKLPTTSPLRKVMMTTISQAENDVKKAQSLLENWYDNSMERVSGFYKQNTQRLLLIVAAVIILGMNIDTITIANRLLENPALRQGLAQQASISSNELKKRQEASALAAAQEATQEAQITPFDGSIGAAQTVNAHSATSVYYTLEQLDLPIGWPDTLRRNHLHGDSALSIPKDHRAGHHDFCRFAGRAFLV